MQSKNENRIQNDIDHGTDQNRKHRCFGSSLSADERIQSQSKLNKNRSQKVDRDVVVGICNGFRTGPKGIQNRNFKNQKADCQHNGKEHEQPSRIAHDQGSFSFIFFPKLNRCKRCPACSGKCTERGNQSDDRKRNPHARQSQITIALHMSDVDSIDDIVQNVDQLCQNRWQCQ